MFFILQEAFSQLEERTKTAVYIMKDVSEHSYEGCMALVLNNALPTLTALLGATKK